jgi:hypothetical protein
VALGGALAMSSTAVLTKLLTERLELDSPHGREVMGVLLFQDLAVVPLLILIPSFSESPERMATMIGLGDAEGRRRAVARTVPRPTPDEQAGSSSSPAASRRNCSCSTCCWSPWAWPT